MSDNKLGIANRVFDSVPGVRVCFEKAMWNSSDGNTKTYYHIHVQHDDIPEFNAGIGDADFRQLIRKTKDSLVPELQQAIERHKKLNP